MNSLVAISNTTLRDSELVESPSVFDSLCADCTELIKLLTSSVKTTKRGDVA